MSLFDDTSKDTHASTLRRSLDAEPHPHELRPPVGPGGSRRRHGYIVAEARVTFVTEKFSTYSKSCADRKRARPGRAPRTLDWFIGIDVELDRVERLTTSNIDLSGTETKKESGLHSTRDILRRGDACMDRKSADVHVAPAVAAANETGAHVSLLTKPARRSGAQCIISNEIFAGFQRPQ
ncbi:hypothetical protein EVAR_43377_1 [Eumeta japonica]|uniref:Uncharacterized protein n=1 Tax=Eumeta variegata TaxID=151549 RepID=A0A4C1WP81_EUMVA|nr:hypothetical protein EVAR_43377_1 [Eumeta japonica]